MRPNRRPSRTDRVRCGLLPLSAALAAALGCQSTPSYPPQWSQARLEVPSERILWQVTVLALEKHEFPIGTELDPVALEATSGWRNELAPFRGQGLRKRARVKYRHVGDGRYEVEVRVEREVNMDIARPLDLQYAQWEPSPDDADEAAILLHRIKAYVGGEFEVSPKESPTWK